MKTFTVPTTFNKSFYTKPYVAASFDDMTVILDISSKRYTATVEIEGCNDILLFSVEDGIISLLDGDAPMGDVIGYIKKGKLHIEVSANYLPHVFSAAVLVVTTYAAQTAL